MAGFRISPPKVFRGAARAPRPPAEAAGAADAHRQTGFVLGRDLDLLIEGFTFEGEVATASAGPRYRTRPAAAVLGLWSRAWLCRLQAMHALEWGNYTAAIPLVRAAADAMAAEALTLQTSGAEWEEWLEAGGIALAPAEHATEYRLHAFRAGEVLAAHPVLGPLYRAVSDFSMPHFGATLLLAGSESGPDRIAMTFGDRDFHLGLAELVLGWLMELGATQLEFLPAYPAVFNLAQATAAEGLAKRLQARATGRDRCHVQTIEQARERRYLVQNWRRTPGAAPKRLLL